LPKTVLRRSGAVAGTASGDGGIAVIGDDSWREDTGKFLAAALAGFGVKVKDASTSR
jgi:hypothetical protein